MSKIVVGIHQPNFLPWLGYFYKFYASDVFVFLDDVKFSPRSYTKRVHIRKAVGSPNKKYITVPIQKESQNTLIKDLEVDTGKDWTQDILNHVKNSYRDSAYFDTYFPALSAWLNDVKEEPHLVDVNIRLIQLIAKELDLSTQTRRSSALAVKGSSAEYIVELVKHFNGDVYLSGTGARSYQDAEDFEKEDISLEYSDFYPFLKDNPYPQDGEADLMGLSIMDALFHIGKEGVLEYFHRFDQHRNT